MRPVQFEMALVQRYDTGRLSAATRTGSGGARVPASIARTGIQVYRDAQGREVREYRSPEAVFAEDSLASLASIPVTVGHPGTVDARSWRRHAVGHVTDAAPTRRADGAVEWLDSAIVVQDATALERIESGALVEVSMGYIADVVPEAGTTPSGERYDAVQRSIKFNHLALLPPGKARAGSGARLRLDGNEELDGDDADGGHVKKVKIDGVEHDFGSESHISALDALLAKAGTSLGELKAKFDAQEAELTKLRAVDVNALVQDELTFRSNIAPALPKDYAFGDKTREQVRADAVGTEVMADVAKLPEAERAGYVSAHLKLKLDGIKAGTLKPERKPLHPVKQDAMGSEPDCDKTKKRPDPVAKAYEDSWKTSN